MIITDEMPILFNIPLHLFALKASHRPPNKIMFCTRRKFYFINKLKLTYLKLSYLHHKSFSERNILSYKLLPKNLKKYNFFKWRIFKKKKKIIFHVFNILKNKKNHIFDLNIIIFILIKYPIKDNLYL